MNIYIRLFLIWLKRLGKRPLFLITLLLIPLSVLFLVHITAQKDSLLQVAVYCPDTEQGSLSHALNDTLLSLSNSAIRFYPCNKKEQVYQAVHDKSADCGYLIPKNLDEAILSYIKNGTPILTAVHAENEMSTKIIDEIVLSKVYRTFSYQFVEDFLMKRLDTPVDTSSLKASYDKYCKDELLFEFEYADGQKEKDSSQNAANYLLLPLRGLLSVMILLVCLCSNYLWYEDCKNGLPRLLPSHTGRKFELISLLPPAILSGTLGLLTLYLTHVGEQFLPELAAMSGLLIACTGLSYLLRNLLPSLPVYLACVPLLVISSLILCPVFFPLESLFPVVSQVNHIFPTQYYLEALHYPQSLPAMALYGILTFLLGNLCSFIRNRFA